MAAASAASWRGTWVRWPRWASLWPWLRIGRAQAMSTATKRSIPPARMASSAGGLRPICLVIASTERPSRSASARIARAFPAIVSRSRR